MGDGSPGSREAEGEGGEGFYIAQSGRRADLPVSPGIGHCSVRMHEGMVRQNLLAMQASANLPNQNPRSEALRERERERERGGGWRAIESKRDRPYKVLNLALTDGQGFGIRPLFGAGAKGVESGVKGRQIQRPFHSD